jgi:murein DD-endopeptidase MepM/ murein hydrolase activator NlpD
MLLALALPAVAHARAADAVPPVAPFASATDPRPPEDGVVRATVTVGITVRAEDAVQGDLAPAESAADDRRRRSRRLSRSPVAVERLPQPDGTVTVALRNLLHAPLTVEVAAGDMRAASVEMLSPGHATIPALGRLDIASLRGINPVHAGEVTFIYSAVVGDPRTRHDDRVVYAWPFPPGVQALLSQGPGGPTHHDAFSRYAIDLVVPEGTPVLAARAGTLVYMETRYFESGMDRARFMSRANHVRILHDDGSMALYAHLSPESVDLEPGQRVEVGERIGLSGNTGYSNGPHLHFVVLLHREMRSVSVPFRMAGVDLRAVAPAPVGP